MASSEVSSDHEMIDSKLDAALKMFVKCEYELTQYEYELTQYGTYIIASDIVFNCATVNRLTAFLCSGVKNRHGQPANELWLMNYSFKTEESLRLLCDFFSSNKSPKTLQKLRLEYSLGIPQDSGEKLVSSLYNNKTITELIIYDEVIIRGATGGKMVGDLLLQNTHLTALDLIMGLVNVEFIRAMRKGLLASRARLNSLGFSLCDMDNEALNELRLVYETNDDGGKQNLVLSELDLYSNVFKGHIGGDRLRRLLLTLPGLKKLNLGVSFDLGAEGTRALFSNGISVLLGRLQSLEFYSNIDNEDVELMAASMPESAALVHLELGTDIEGHDGGEALSNLLSRCGFLEKLELSHNEELGPAGAIALTPALGNLLYLQFLVLDRCRITHDGATHILASLTTARIGLKSLGLGKNDLTVATLVSLTAYLNGPGRCLEVLNLEGNNNLFGTVDQQPLARPFYEVIANHKAMQRLDVRGCGVNADETDGLLQSAVFKNSSLVTVNRKKAEYVRRDKLMALIQSTMVSPTNVPPALWPTTLGAYTPRLQQVSGHSINCLVRKMAEMDVFDFERKESNNLIIDWWRGRMKERACARIQRCWRRRQNPPSSAANLVQGIRGHVDFSRKRKRSFA